MFFLQLDEAQLKKALELAEKRAMSVEQIVRLALQNGLGSLNGKEPHEAQQQPVYSAVTRRQSIDRYITEHWQTETDEEMGSHLGLATHTITAYRARLAFLRPSQRREPNIERGKYVEAYIREHWQTQTDEEMASNLDLKVSTVQKYCLGLKIHRPTQNRGRYVDDYITKHWQTQTDEEIASHLEVSISSVRAYRTRLGFLRPSQRREPNIERGKYVEAYIREHWQTQTDEEIASHLEVSISSVRAYRTRLGFLRPRPRLDCKSRVVQQFDESSKVDELIRQHWEHKSDGEIARLAKVGRGTITMRRHKLGLLKTKGTTTHSNLRLKIQEIGLEHIEKMLTQEGYTMTDLIAQYNLHFTRERVRQVLDDMGVKHTPAVRKPEWLINHRARKVGNMNLANREWLGEQLSGSESIAQLAAALNIQEANLYFFIRTFKLTHPSLRKHGTETVDLVCSNPKCEKQFKRLKRGVDYRLKKVSDPSEAKFYCSMPCVGHASGKRPNLEKRWWIDAYIQEHWKDTSDKAIGDILGIGTTKVAKHRLQLGFHRDGHGNPILEN